MQKFARFTVAVFLAVCGGVLLHRGGERLQGADAPAPSPAAPIGLSGATTEASPIELTGNSAQAGKLLHEARQRLFALTSVQADLREFVVLGERRFEAVGRYIAGPFNPLPQLRLEYRVRVGDTEGDLLEVCDGQILRSQRTIRRLGLPPAGEAPPAGPASSAGASSRDGQVTVTRRDVRKILEAVQRHGPTPETILQAELGIGGLPALLTSLERAMTFESVEEEPLGGRRCYVLTGRWRPEFFAEMQRHFAHFKRDVDSHLPELARIHLDAEHLFPVRLAYWPPPTKAGPPSAPTLTMEFTNIRINEPVASELFQFESNGADESDITSDFIEAIKGAAQAAPKSN